MYLRYRLYRVYDIGGLVFGILMITLGCITIFKSLSGAFLIIFGAYLVFTDSACVIDVTHYRISFPYQLFGFINIGKWMYVRRDMELLLTETKKPFKVRCASNRIIDVSDAKYLLLLYDSKEKKSFLILKTKSKEKAEKELVRLSDLLDIQIREGSFSGQYKVLKI